MASVNKVILVGNPGADPETRYMPSGDAVTNIRPATTDRYRDKASGDMKELTEWHRVAFFGKLAEIAGQYLRKGSRVYIEGRIRTRKWQDQSGRTSTAPRSSPTRCRCWGRARVWVAAVTTWAAVAVVVATAAAARPRAVATAVAAAGAAVRAVASRGGARRQQQAPSNGFEDMDDDIPF